MWHFRVKYNFICPCPPSSLFHHHRLYVLSLCVLLPFYLFCGSSISSFLVYRDLKRRGGRASSLLDIVCVRVFCRLAPEGVFMLAVRARAPCFAGWPRRASSCLRFYVCPMLCRLAPEGIFTLAVLAPEGFSALVHWHTSSGAHARSEFPFPSFSTCTCILSHLLPVLAFAFCPTFIFLLIFLTSSASPYLTTAKMNNTYRR